MVDGVSVELVPQLCFLPILILVELMYLCWVRSRCCCQEVLMFSVFWKLYPEFPLINCHFSEADDGDDVWKRV